MKAADRKALQALIDRLVPMVGEFEQALVLIEPIADAEQEKADNLSERAADTDRGVKIAEDAENLDTAKSECEAARDAIDNVINALQEVLE